MNLLEINKNNINPNNLDFIVDYFLREKVVVYPSDTVYGIGCIATSKKAIEKVFNVKHIKKKKPLIVLIKSYCMLKKYFFVSGKQDRYLREVWSEGNKPTTVILKSRGLIDKSIEDQEGGVGVRMPNDIFLKILIKKINIPIISTSANITMQDSLVSMKGIEKYYKNYKPDLVIDSGPSKTKKASKLVDIRDINNISIIRS